MIRVCLGAGWKESMDVKSAARPIPDEVRFSKP